MNMQGKVRAGAMLAIMCAGLSLSGCARMGAMSRVDPVSIAIYPGGLNAADSQEQAGLGSQDCPLVRGVNSFGRGAVNLDCFVFPEDGPPLPGARNAPESDATEAAPSTRGQRAYARAVSNRRDRNRLTALLLKHSDDICVEEMARLNSNEAAVNTSLSIITTGLTAAANIVSGELAQSILVGGANFSSGSRTAINAHVYRNTFAYAISRAITLEREKLRGELETRLADRDENAFTVDDAIRAVNAYHGVCSFYKGLELVLAAVEGGEDVQRNRAALLRQTQIEAIDREIAQQTAQMRRMPEGNRGPYVTRIDALTASRQVLVLGTGQPDQGDGEEDEDAEDENGGDEDEDDDAGDDEADDANDDDADDDDGE
jgi:hypothetical protein